MPTIDDLINRVPEVKREMRNNNQRMLDDWYYIGSTIVRRDKVYDIMAVGIDYNGNAKVKRYSVARSAKKAQDELRWCDSTYTRTSRRTYDNMMLRVV